jgi:hypothetical protein
MEGQQKYQAGRFRLGLIEVFYRRAFAGHGRGDERVQSERALRMAWGLVFAAASGALSSLCISIIIYTEGSIAFAEARRWRQLTPVLVLSSRTHHPA